MSIFDTPPEGERIRSLVAERLEQAKAENGAKITIDWRGEQKHLYVITMPVDVLYFNPDTHRIRAQRKLDANRNAKLESDPWGEGSQQYLCHLLSRKPSNPDQLDPDYVALREELEKFGQKEPGILSPEGILVDGNTRCAALRELGVQDIRVGILPPDTSRRDINDVELALQLRRDKRREYSYINRLIAIEEELSRGRREEEVARNFNIKTTTLRQDRWVHQLIKEAIRRSQTTNGAALREIDFEDHQEKLRELQRDYAKMAATDPEAAEKLKETRLSMVILNYPKTSVRLAEADFYSRYLEKRLPDELRPTARATGTVAIPGLPGVEVSGSSAEVETARALTDSLLTASARMRSSDGPAADATAASVRVKLARQTFDAAVKMAGQNAQLQKRKVIVTERITDAADYVNQCALEFADARAKHALDEEAFDDALLTLRSSLSRLARQAGRAFSTPSDGVAWLLESTKDD